MSKIVANNIDIHKSVVIGDNVNIHCDSIKIGKFGRIGNNVNITCKNFEADEWLYICDNVEVGRGGCNGPNSNVKIGKHVGIGGEVMIWTHGAWLDVTQGFPSDFGPVKIGSRVWLPARSIVLPNVSVGDDTVIGIGSVINRDLPSGCFAAGSPCKVIREDCYPKELNDEELKRKCLEITSDWCKLLKDKNISDIDVEYENGRIILKQGTETILFTHYDVKEKEIIGYVNEVSEDLRDYLRRRGIKIYTDKPFKSIKPEWL